ncbi:response regulator transcription factor [Desulfotomaculum copahuensis]|nr:response regulator transcription factor [Desulfotomaculum copahuensis]
MDRILVVDDEEPVCALVRMYLENEGFPVETAGDGEEALSRVKSGYIRLVLLDLMLPGLDGWTVCREIRKFSPVPIIMLTAKGEEFDRVMGLELGADDYMAKPFSPRELVARVKAVLRRTEQAGARERTLLIYPGLTIDCNANRVEVSGREVQLAPKEFELLCFLASRPRRVFTRDYLLEKVWDYNYTGDGRTVDTHIKRLREKLKTESGRSYLKTVWGKGYKFEVTE